MNPKPPPPSGKLRLRRGAIVAALAAASKPPASGRAPRRSEDEYPLIRLGADGALWGTNGRIVVQVAYEPEPGMDKAHPLQAETKPETCTVPPEGLPMAAEAMHAVVKATPLPGKLGHGASQIVTGMPALDLGNGTVTTVYGAAFPSGVKAPPNKGMLPQLQAVVPLRAEPTAAAGTVTVFGVHVAQLQRLIDAVRAVGCETIRLQVAPMQKSDGPPRVNVLRFDAGPVSGALAAVDGDPAVHPVGYRKPY